MLLCEPFPRSLFQALSKTYNLKNIATFNLILQKVSNRISFNDKRPINRGRKYNYTPNGH